MVTLSRSTCIFSVKRAVHLLKPKICTTKGYVSLAAAACEKRKAKQVCRYGSAEDGLVA